MEAFKQSMGNSMKKYLTMFSILIFAMSMTGCEKEAKESTANYDMPEGLKDCKVFSLKNDSGSWITVVRCPLSSTSTTYSSGKSTATATVVEQDGTQQTNNTIKNKTADTVEIDGKTYRKSSTMKDIQINGESYKEIE